MPTIRPVTNLRSYTDVLDCVKPGSPVFLTRNGHGRYAILDINDYDKLVAEKALLKELERGRLSGETEGWVSADDVRESFRGVADGNQS